MKNTAILAALLTISSGCASTTVRNLGSDEVSSQGIIYYEPMPHLKILRTVDSADKPSGSTASIIYLPNRDRPRRLTWSGGLFGSANPNFKLENGWNLTGFETTVDSGFSAVLENIPGIRESTGDEAPHRVVVEIYPLTWDSGKWKIGPPLSRE